MIVRARSRLAKVRVVWVLAAMGALAAGCGLSTNDEPERIGDGSAIDDSATTEPAATVSGSSGGEAGAENVEVWFVETLSDASVQLVFLERPVADADSADERLLALIREPPTGAETDDRDIVSHVPDDTDLGEVELRSNGVLAVELSDNFYDRRGEEAVYAFAQVVFTATELEGVSQVLFRNASDFLPLDGDGETRDGPLGRQDYNELEVGS